jgi:hypothetical protein
MKIAITCILFYCCLIISGQITVHGQENHEAFVESYREGNFIGFRGIFINNLDGSIDGRYQMEATKTGSSGRSVSRQGGNFELAGKSKGVLSNILVVADDQDFYKVVLNVYSGEKLLCADSIVISGHQMTGSVKLKF